MSFSLTLWDLTKMTDATNEEKILAEYVDNEIERTETEMLNNGFSKPYVASIIARMKNKQKKRIRKMMVEGR